MKNQTRIIAQNLPQCEPLSWQEQLKGAVTSIEALHQQLNLGDLLPEAKLAQQQFPLIAPQAFIEKMQKGNPRDPLLLQILPDAEEMQINDAFSADPLAENQLNQPKGLLQKYHGRALLLLAGKCAINCRYCFRRHFPYQDHRISADDWQDILGYLKNDSSINEVIFSGGEPLMVSDAKLQQYLDDLALIPHLTRVRIHTRLPITIAERLTETLATLLSETRLNAVLVLHSNHPNEIDAALKSKIMHFRQAGIHFLNQSVLLKGVNDTAETLIELSETLFDAGILPYYLHQLDKVQGAAHFQISTEQALELHQEMQLKLPGFLVPKLVQEIAGEGSKTLIQNHPNTDA